MFRFRTVSLNILVLLASWTFSSLQIFAQVRNESEAHWGNQFRFKLQGGIAANQYWVNFPELNGYEVFTPRNDVNPGPPNFGNSPISYGYWGGIGVDIPLASTLALSIVTNGQTHNTRLSTEERTRVGTFSGASADAVIRHIYDINLITTGGDALFAWRPFEGAGLSICAGARGAWLYDRRISQREELVEPSYGAFSPAGDRTRNVRQGNINNTQQIQAHVLGALRYDIAIPLQGVWLLISPEVQVGYPLTRITTSETWQLAFARGGISIGFANKPEVVMFTEPVGPTLPSSDANVPVRKQ